MIWLQNYQITVWNLTWCEVGNSAVLIILIILFYIISEQTTKKKWKKSHFPKVDRQQCFVPLCVCKNCECFFHFTRLLRAETFTDRLFNVYLDSDEVFKPTHRRNLAANITKCCTFHLQNLPNVVLNSIFGNILYFYVVSRLKSIYSIEVILYIHSKGICLV